MPLLRRFVLAAAAGGALLLATPPIGWWPLAPLGAALLLLAVVDRPGEIAAAHLHRRAFALASIAALVYLLPVLRWAAAPGLDAWIALSVAEALMFALLGPALRLVTRLRGYPLWAALVWVADEALRDRVPFGGFPWARLAFTQPHTPFTPLAALGGAPLVSAGVAVTGSVLAAAVLHARRPSAHRASTVAVSLAAVALPAAALLALDANAAPPAPATGSGARFLQIAAVQGNVPGGHPFAAEQQAGLVLATHLSQTARLVRQIGAGRVPPPQLVIWPEDSVNLDPLADRAAAAALDRAAASVRSPLLVGAVLNGPRPGTRYNAGMLWGAAGPLGPVYLKRHPVPFGEYLPYRPEIGHLLPQFTRLLTKDFLPGRRPGLLPAAGTTVGDVICFEVAYDGLVRDTVTGGARLLVVQTNNATFGRSGESAQQVAMAQLRAVEHDRSVTVASTVGISAVISPTGAVLARTRPFTPGLLTGRVPLINRITLADHLGGLPEGLLTAAGALALVVAAAAHRRRGVAPSRPDHSRVSGLEGWSGSGPERVAAAGIRPGPTARRRDFTRGRRASPRVHPDLSGTRHPPRHAGPAPRGGPRRRRPDHR